MKAIPEGSSEGAKCILSSFCLEAESPGPWEVRLHHEGRCHRHSRFILPISSKGDSCRVRTLLGGGYLVNEILFFPEGFLV